MQFFQKISTLLLLAAALMGLFGCKNPIETVEIFDEAGVLSQRYQQNRKTAVKNGTFEAFYPNGTLREQRFYRNDTLQGIHTFYDAKGVKDSEQQYENGKLHGMYRKFFPNGQIQQEMLYEKDVLTGIGKTYYPDGTLKESVTFADNEENGPFTEYHPNGKLKTQGTYRLGDNEQDTLKMFDTDGNLEKVMFCEMGRCTTITKQ